jgi:histidine triad (HIT) family protein
MLIKKLSTLLCIFVLLGSLALFSRNSSMAERINRSSLQHHSCPFCNEENVHYQGFYESKNVIALFNYRPVLEGHSLIIPKRHVEKFEDLTSQELIEIGECIRKTHLAFKDVYHKDDYLLVLQNGKNGGQTVPHVHFHMIPRGSELTSLIKAKLWLSFLTDVTGLSEPIKPAEMFKNTSALQKAIREQ